MKKKKMENKKKKKKIDDQPAQYKYCSNQPVSPHNTMEIHQQYHNN